MLRYCDLMKNETEFLAMTGMTVKEFDALVPTFRACYEEHLEKYTIDGYERQNRRKSSYRTATFKDVADALLFILVYLKQYPTQTMLGCLFGMKQPQANLWIHVLHPILNCTLDRAGHRPARAGDIPEFTDEDDENSPPVSPFLSMMGASGL